MLKRYDIRPRRRRLAEGESDLPTAGEEKDEAGTGTNGEA
jgi:hypothetical protein